MKDNLTVFDFRVWFDGDIENGWGVQHRYVVSSTEEEAVAKMKKYVKQLKKEGFAHLNFDDQPVVELDGVIG